MINPQRLSRYITSRDCIKSRSVLLSMYESLSSSQRQEIKLLLKTNKDDK